MSSIDRFVPSLKGRTLLQAGVIAVVAWAVYLPALHGGWLWDDPVEVSNNVALRTWSGLVTIWLRPPGTDYYPLKSTVQWLLWHAAGDRVAAYHWTSLCLHVLGALLFWRVLGKLGVRYAWAGGMIFAAHPLAVESVAWISELKNTLSLPLFLLSFSAYIDFESGSAHRRRHYWAALAWFTAGMLAKASIVGLPAILLLYLLWKRGRVRRADAMRLIPFFLVGLALGVVTLWFQIHRAIGIGEPPPVSNALTTLARALMAICFYIVKSFIPSGLMPIYPYWPLGSEHRWELVTGVVFLLLFAWSCLWLPARPRRPSPSPVRPWLRDLMFGAGCLLALLAPVVGMAPMSYLRVSSVADHLAYLALLPIIALAVAASGKSAGRVPVWAAAAVLALLVGTLARQGHAYARMFRDEEVLWRFNVERNPGSAIAADNLGITLARRGQMPEALMWFEKASRLNPDFARVQNNLGMALREKGRLAEALAAFNRAVQIRPTFVLACDNLAMALAGAGRFPEARERLRQALAIQPDFSDGRNHLGLILAQEGLWNEAIAQYRLALQEDPTSASAYSNLGLALSSVNRPAEAAAAEEKALELRPDFPEAHNNLGTALLALGATDRAVAEYAEAVRLEPANANTENNLGFALAQAGRRAEAIRHYKRALQLDPESAEALNNLGNELFASGRLAEAIARYREALVWNPLLIRAHNNLGVALQQAGRLQEAVTEYRKALRLRPDARAELNLGTALATVGMTEEAVGHYRRALALDPRLAEGHYRLGESLEGMGRFSEAIQEYEQALALKPDYVQARAALPRARSRLAPPAGGGA